MTLPYIYHRPEYGHTGPYCWGVLCWRCLSSCTPLVHGPPGPFSLLLTVVVMDAEIYKKFSEIRLKVSFQFFADKNLKRTENILWQSDLVLKLFLWISLDWTQGTRHSKMRLMQISVHSVQELKQISPSLNIEFLESFQYFVNKSQCLETSLSSGRGTIK